MKRIIAILLLAALVGCTTHTEYGQCIGAFGDKDPKLVYKVSGWNLFMAIIGLELIAPPIFVVVDMTLCPIGEKNDRH